MAIDAKTQQALLNGPIRRNGFGNDLVAVIGIDRRPDLLFSDGQIAIDSFENLRALVMGASSAKSIWDACDRNDSLSETVISDHVSRSGTPLPLAKLWCDDSLDSLIR